METLLAEAKVYADKLGTVAECHSQMRDLQAMIATMSPLRDLAESGALLLAIYERMKVLEVAEAPEVHGR